MINFCTLFDRNYFYKGLAMYNSLAANCSEEFTLWILCMDDLTYELLEKMNLRGIKLVSLKEFESPELLKAKSERGVAEYSWTCASNFIWFLSQSHPELEMITYLDADLYFFNDPKILIDELGNNDVMITEHRYTKKYDQASVSGKYCVQFMVFRCNPNGLKILDWWRSACLDWCFGYLDNGRFGDQKYLDDWTVKFEKVHELQHLGGGVAPWNVQQYDFTVKDGKVFGHLKGKREEWPLVFYHFHGFCLLSKNRYFGVNGYVLSREVGDIIYRQYFKALRENLFLIKGINHDFNFGFKKVSFKDRIYTYIISNALIEKIYLNFKNKLYGQKNKG